MRLSELIGGHARIARPGSGIDAIGVSGLALDSRAVAQGNLFAALPGAKLDGLSFVPAAVVGWVVALEFSVGDGVAPERSQAASPTTQSPTKPATSNGVDVIPFITPGDVHLFVRPGPPA